MRIILQTVTTLLLTIAASAPLAAHPLVLKGTVVSAEPAGVTIRFVDPDTKKTVTEVFQIDKETKILRGDKLVTFAEARITTGEPIAITVDLDNDDHLADVIRLDSKKRQPHADRRTTEGAHGCAIEHSRTGPFSSCCS